MTDLEEGTGTGTGTGADAGAAEGDEPEEAKSEEPKSEEPKSEEPNSEEPNSEEPKSEETTKAELRRGLRKIERAIELVREAFAELNAADRPGVIERLAGLEAELDELRPPEPRKCREYSRASLRMRKGLMGIDPELVVLYCRCFECATLRAKKRLEQPTLRTLSPLLEDSTPSTTPTGFDSFDSAIHSSSGLPTKA